MPTLPDLVLDTKLNTEFQGELVVHTRFDAQRGSRRKARVTEKWERLDRLGTGGFGVVWLEKRVDGNAKGELRAVKELRKTTPTNWEYWQELEALTKFSHVNACIQYPRSYSHLFVQSYGWFESPSSIFIAMEYMASGDLQNYVKGNGALTDRDAKIIVAQVLKGLISMHENNFIHREIKPTNMMLVKSGPEWWIKLIDFGISKRNVTALSSLSAETPRYMAPETLGISRPDTSPDESILEDQPVTPALDLWGLGVSAFYLLTGELPFAGMMDIFRYAMGQQKLPQEMLASRGLSTACLKFVQSLLSTNPIDRPTSFEALRHAWLQEEKQETLGWNNVSTGDSSQDVPGTYPLCLPEHTSNSGPTRDVLVSSQDSTVPTKGVNLDCNVSATSTVSMDTVSRIQPEQSLERVLPEVTAVTKANELPLSPQRLESVPCAHSEALEDSKSQPAPIRPSSPQTEAMQERKVPIRPPSPQPEPVDDKELEPKPIPQPEAVGDKRSEHKPISPPSPQLKDVSSGAAEPSTPMQSSSDASSANVPQNETAFSSSSDPLFTEGLYKQNGTRPQLKFPVVSYTQRFSFRRSVHFTMSSTDTMAPKPSRLSSTDFSPPGPNPLPFSVSSEPISLCSRRKPTAEMNESGHSYQYDRLDKRQIRLLRLHRGKITDPIQCSLAIFSVPGATQSEVPPYTALSYAWGTDEPSKKISIIEKQAKSGLDSPTMTKGMGNPSVFMIRDNLFTALKQLRREETEWWFWVAAICINQENDDEKSHQLPKLLHIYSHAYNVCIWLGESVESDNENPSVQVHPFDFIPNIVNLRALDTMLSTRSEDLGLLNGWTSFARLLRAPWFRRRWVIQEIAASARAFVQIGARRVDWVDFSDAIELFVSKIESIRRMFEKKGLNSELEELSHIEVCGAAAIASTANNLIRKTEQGVIIDRLLNIETLISTFKHFEATNPSDIVYALLPLAYDGHGPERAMTLARGAALLTPDYSQPYWKVYMDFVRHSIQTTRSLDIICRDWAPNISTEGFKGKYRSLPSWIPAVAKSPFDQRAEQTGRLVGESLVGPPGKAAYNASRGMPMFARFTEDATTDPNITELVLWTRGVKLSTITQISDPVLHGIISKESLHLAGWSGGNYDELSDRVWRTLTADRDVDGKHTPYWFRRACQLCLTKTHDGDLNTTRLLLTKLLPDTVMTYLRRVQAVVWNRRFFECSSATDDEANFFGLGPRDLRVGDIVCILFGCSVPVVLREVTGFKSPCYKLIGECYVHGYMDGEALAGLDDAAIDGAALHFNLR